MGLLSDAVVSKDDFASGMIVSSFYNSGKWLDDRGLLIKLAVWDKVWGSVTLSMVKEIGQHPIFWTWQLMWEKPLAQWWLERNVVSGRSGTTLAWCSFKVWHMNCSDEDLCFWKVRQVYLQCIYFCPSIADYWHRPSLLMSWSEDLRSKHVGRVCHVYFSVE